VTADDSGRILARAAARAEADSFFVASALALYRSLTEMDDGALAAFLGCDEASLPRLALCRRPSGESRSFRADVGRIAEFTGCDPSRLATLLRAASTAERMRSASPGTLLAARDRPSMEPTDEDGHEEPEP
jgi:hypothetical protein